MNQTPEQTKELINRKQANIIFDRFDFDKVFSYMQLVGWQYVGRPVTLEDIKNTAKRLLYDSVRDFEETGIPYSNCGTGGFTVTRFPWGLSLTFSIETTRNY